MHPGYRHGRIHLLVELKGSLVEVEVDAVLARGELYVVASLLAVHAPVEGPVGVGAELDFLVLGRLEVGPEADIVFVVVHLYVRGASPSVDGAHDAYAVDAPLFGEYERLAVK